MVLFYVFLKEKNMEIDKIMAELDSVGYYSTKNIAYTVNAAVSCNKPLLIEAVFYAGSFFI